MSYEASSCCQICCSTQGLISVKIWHVRMICSVCKVNLAGLLSKFPALPSLKYANQIQPIIAHLRSIVDPIDKTDVQGRTKVDRQAARVRLNKSITRFGIIKKYLVQHGLICRNRLKWQDKMHKHKDVIKLAVRNPYDYLEFYIKTYGHDPRHPQFLSGEH